MNHHSMKKSFPAKYAASSTTITTNYFLLEFNLVPVEASGKTSDFNEHWSGLGGYCIIALRSVLKLAL